MHEGVEGQVGGEGVVDLEEGGVEGDVAEEDQGEGEDLQGARSLHFISLFKSVFFLILPAYWHAGYIVFVSQKPET